MVQVLIDALATTIQALVNMITAMVETAFDAVAARIDAISDGTGVLRQRAIGDERHAGKQETELCRIPYGPCVHVLTP